MNRNRRKQKTTPQTAVAAGSPDKGSRKNFDLFTGGQSSLRDWQVNKKRTCMPPASGGAMPEAEIPHYAGDNYFKRDLLIRNSEVIQILFECILRREAGIDKEAFFLIPFV